MSAEEITDNAVVSIPVREMLQEQTNLLREIDRKVDTKADRSELAPIVSEVSRAHDRIQIVEDANKWEEVVKQDRSKRRRFYAGVFTAVLVPIGSTLIYVFH